MTNQMMEVSVYAILGFFGFWVIGAFTIFSPVWFKKNHKDEEC